MGDVLEKEVVDTSEETADTKQIVIFDDNHNTFEHVIETLIRVCKHSAVQAEQCTILIHFKGKCTVKTGPYHELEPMCSKLLEADLTAEIQ